MDYEIEITHICCQGVRECRIVRLRGLTPSFPDTFPIALRHKSPNAYFCWYQWLALVHPCVDPMLLLRQIVSNSKELPESERQNGNCDWGHSRGNWFRFREDSRGTWVQNRRNSHQHCFDFLLLFACPAKNHIHF